MIRKYLPAILLFFPVTAFLHGQAVPAFQGGGHLVAGGFYSQFSPDYGPNQLLGIGTFVDYNLRRRLSLEGEARFLRFNQLYNVHQDNYLIGPRYRWRLGRWEPYGKFLVGNGQFNFPFNYGHGGYLVLAPGGGVDIHSQRFYRFTLRADYEYQHWTDFQGGSVSPHGFTVGIGYRIF